MIFREIYGVYYQAVAAVLAEAVCRPVGEAELWRIVEAHAFGESAAVIVPALLEERWPLLRKDGTTPIKRKPDMPLTLIQKRWLKAISLDPRIRLFGEEIPDFPEVQPLFRPENVRVFDSYNDGDPYEDETYITNFRLILDAIRNQYPLYIEMRNRRGEVLGSLVLPERLEYSEKDDKFRLIGAGNCLGSTINLGRILSCRRAELGEQPVPGRYNPARLRSVIFELADRRNALERVLLHFAHFRKEAERIAEDRYRITVFYDKEDETELVIRILSFGPLIKVTAPSHFVGLIRQRLMEQMNCKT